MYGVPHGSVLSPLLFLLYINDLHDAIKYSMVHQFSDDTNLLLFDSSLKSITKKNKHWFKITMPLVECK